jgi:threonine synthase
VADPILSCPVCKNPLSLSKGLFSCPNARPGEEHILNKELQPAPPTSPASGLATRLQNRWQQEGLGPFTIFRELLGSHALAREELFLTTLTRLEQELTCFEKKPFQVTPLLQAQELSRALGMEGNLFIKNETINITGSHKGRHLMGTLLYLEALRALSGNPKKTLAVYSCGNAALAAAAVARAGGYSLRAFVPEDIDPVVEAMLREREAVVEKASRTGDASRGTPENTPGDPTYLAFRHALDQGCLPFSCSGNDNWSNIEGGQTLGWEMCMQLRDLEDAENALDHVVLQIGGGALARALVQSCREFHALGLLPRLPRFHACQPVGGFPFVRSWYLVLADIAEQAGLLFGPSYVRSGNPLEELNRIRIYLGAQSEQVQAVVEFACSEFSSEPVQGVLRRCLLERDRYMWAWDGLPPHSAAHGILDDETYDWFYLLEGLLETGGHAVVMEEEEIERAYQLARQHTPVRASHTGTAGLAGLMRLNQTGIVKKKDSVGLLFTGVDR